MSHRTITSPSQHAQIEDLVFFFRDPPNADELRLRIRPLTQTVTNDIDNTLPSNTKYRGLQFDSFSTRRSSEENRQKVFLATLYLRDCLQLIITNRQYNLQKVNITIHNEIKELCNQLNRDGDLLKGVTPTALLSLYNKILEKRRALEEILKKATSEVFNNTRFSDLALELLDLSNEINEAKETQNNIRNARAKSNKGITNAAITALTAINVM
ncbi:hypothetical protein FBU30_005831 [Linnemannia zychae]|nr:hypothetical protein FBU30_005831 [Linnemannia zychae]